MPEEREKRGNLSETKAHHLRIRSSGSGFEDLIEGRVDPDIPYGEQMTPEALKRYYDQQLKGVRMYLDLTPEQRRMIMSVAEGFERDLAYLADRGIDTTDAKLVFEKLKAIK